MSLERFPRGIAVLSTPEGEELGKKLGKTFSNSYYVGTYTRELLSKATECYDAVVLVMSLPGAFRVTCEVLKGKGEGPAVVVVDPLGKFVIPLANAHWGANELAEELAEKIGATAVITTVAERRGLKPLEALARELYAELEPKELIVSYYKAILNGETICTDFDPPEGYSYLRRGDDCVLRITTECRQGTLCLKPYSLFVGIGAKPNAEDLSRRAVKVLEDLRVPKGRVKAVGSVREEARGVAEALGAEFRLFSFDELRDFNDDCLSPPSDTLKSMGLIGVAEIIALKLAGERGKLLVRKVKGEDFTLAVAGVAQ